LSCAWSCAPTLYRGDHCYIKHIRFCSLGISTAWMLLRFQTSFESHGNIKGLQLTHDPSFIIKTFHLSFGIAGLYIRASDFIPIRFLLRTRSLEHYGQHEYAQHLLILKIQIINMPSCCDSSGLLITTTDGRFFKDRVRMKRAYCGTLCTSCIYE